MFKFEIARELTCEQYGAFIKTIMPVSHALPDGRMVLWFSERDLHEFVVAWNVAHPLETPEQLELELNDGIITETVPVHTCPSIINNEGELNGTGM